MSYGKKSLLNIIDENYNYHTLKPMREKLIFKRLLLKLTTESTFISNIKYDKQTDGCTMVGPLSVVSFDIYMKNLRKTLLTSRKQKYFIDEMFTRCKTNVLDQSLEFLNNYHPNIKFTCEINPEKFLNIKICCNNSLITTKVHRKVTKLTPDWFSSIPKKCHSRRFV